MENVILTREFAAQLRKRGYGEDDISRELETMKVGQPERRENPFRPLSAHTLTTQSGEHIDLLAPNPNSITIEDIAHGLGAVCRFSGQTRHFYSVAQHSIMVAQLVPPQLRKVALLHDASEAYIQDVPSPIKVLLPDYSVMEQRLMRAIQQSLIGRNDLPPHAHQLIKEADKIAASIEMRDLFDGHFPPELTAQAPINISIEWCLTPDQAREAFIKAWRAMAQEAP